CSSAIPRAPPPTLFPYTTLFRSRVQGARARAPRRVRARPAPDRGRIDEGDARVTSVRLRVAVVDYGAGNLVSIDQALGAVGAEVDRKSTRLNSSHVKISYAVFCL